MKEEIIAAIVKFAIEKGSVSFVNVEHIFEEHNFHYEGELIVSAQNHEDLVYWSRWNQEAFDIIEVAKKRGRLKMHPASARYYDIDGRVLQFKLFQGKYSRKEPQWLPVVWEVDRSKNIKEEKRIQQRLAKLKKKK